MSLGRGKDQIVWEFAEAGGYRELKAWMRLGVRDLH